MNLFLVSPVIPLLKDNHKKYDFRSQEFYCFKKFEQFKNYLKWGGVIDHGHLTAIPADKWKLRDNENYNFNNESDYDDDDPDLRFVKKITRPDFQAKTFTH